MNAPMNVGIAWSWFGTAGLCLMLVGTGCAQQNRASDPLPSAQTLPVQVESVELQGHPLATGESIRAEQDFALKLRMDRPLFLYVVLEHADRRRELLHRATAAVGSGTPTGVGRLRLPGIGDWFFLPKVLTGDRLCVIASLRSQTDFSCDESAVDGLLGRGEDQPPPPPPPPREAKASAEPKRPPPPDDLGPERGKARWVLPLPLSTP